MMMMETPPISASDAIDGNRHMLSDSRVLLVTLCGDAGTGKTALLEQTLRRLSERGYRAAVIVANPKADRDARQLEKVAKIVVPVRTAILDARKLHDALARIPLDGLDVLFIEAVAALMDSTPIELGQHALVPVFSVSGGDDKAAEFPHGVADADLVLLNKLDLLPHVHFNPRVFESDIRRLNLDVPVLHVSAALGTGMDRWENWLVDQLRRAPRSPAAEWLQPPEVFLG
jgi:hydrogenase nickel incorporation protein HypB